MTKYYSRLMWSRYLKGICYEKHRILDNPAIAFAEKAKAGEFDNIPDEAYNSFLDDVEEEAALFENKPCASSYVLFIRGLQKLSLGPKERRKIAQLLSTISENVNFKERNLKND